MAQNALKMKPKEGELLSMMQIAKKCKLHRATITSRLEDLGYEPDPTSTPKNQLYWFDSEMELAIRSAKDTFSAVRIRDVRAAAQLKEIKLAEAQGLLVPMGEAVEIVQRIVGTLYQEHTIRQPKRIAAKLAKAKNIAEVKKVLKADNSRIMKSLRENFERFIA